MKTYRVWFGYAQQTMEELHIVDVSDGAYDWARFTPRWDMIVDQDGILWIATELEV